MVVRCNHRWLKSSQRAALTQTLKTHGHHSKSKVGDFQQYSSLRDCYSCNKFLEDYNCGWEFPRKVTTAKYPSHPTERALTSDWFVKYSVMVICEKSFSRALDIKFWLNFKKILTDNLCKTICEQVRSECSSCKVPNAVDMAINYSMNEWTFSHMQNCRKKYFTWTVCWAFLVAMPSVMRMTTLLA